MVRLLVFTLLAAATIEVASAVAPPAPQNTALVIVFHRDDGPIATVEPMIAGAVVVDDKTPTESASDDDAVIGEDGDYSIEGWGKHRRNRCRSDLDCDLGHKCNGGFCSLGCQTDTDCRRGQKCLGFQCHTGDGNTSPVCRPYKQHCNANEECCSGSCRLGWKLTRECKHNKH